MYNQPVETVKDYPSIPSLCIYICSTIWYEVQHFINDTVKSRASIPTIMRELAHWDITKNSLQYHHTSYELLNRGRRLFTIIFLLKHEKQYYTEKENLKMKHLIDERLQASAVELNLLKLGQFQL